MSQSTPPHKIAYIIKYLIPPIANRHNLNRYFVIIVSTIPFYYTFVFPPVIGLYIQNFFCYYNSCYYFVPITTDKLSLKLKEVPVQSSVTIYTHRRPKIHVYINLIATVIMLMYACPWDLVRIHIANPDVQETFHSFFFQF